MIDEDRQDHVLDLLGRRPALSKREVSRRTGVSHSTVSRIAAGELPIDPDPPQPTPEEIRQGCLTIQSRWSEEEGAYRASDPHLDRPRSEVLAALPLTVPQTHNDRHRAGRKPSEP